MLFMIGAILLVDQLTKWLTHTNIPLISYAPNIYPYGGIPVFQNFFGIDFSINYLTNRGAAWGQLSQFQSSLLLLRVILILGMGYYIAFVNTQKERIIPFCLILAGAIGNVIDTFVYGYVIDMIHFVFWGYDYPVFNIADCAICIGVIWLIKIFLWPQEEHAHSSS